MDHEKIKKIIKWLKEPSTIRAIIIFAGLLGYGITTQEVNAYATAAASLLSLFELFPDEKKGGKPD